MDDMGSRSHSSPQPPDVVVTGLTVVDEARRRLLLGLDPWQSLARYLRTPVADDERASRSRAACREGARSAEAATSCGASIPIETDLRTVVKAY